MLRVLGARSRARLVRMLQGLGLSAAEAEIVLAYGVEHGLFEADGADPDALRIGPQEAPEPGSG